MMEILKICTLESLDAMNITSMAKETLQIRVTEGSPEGMLFWLIFLS